MFVNKLIDAAYVLCKCCLLLLLLLLLGLFTLYLLSLWNTAPGWPQDLFYPTVSLAHFHTVFLFHWVYWAIHSRIPQGFTAYLYSRAGVAIP